MTINEVAFVSTDYWDQILCEKDWLRIWCHSEKGFNVSADIFQRATSFLNRQEDIRIHDWNPNSYNKAYLLNGGIAVLRNPGIGYFTEIGLRHESIEGLKQQAQFLGLPTNEFAEPPFFNLTSGLNYWKTRKISA